MAEASAKYVIKRYANRSLYDTKHRKFTTLGEVVALVDDGVELVVVDHVTGADYTAEIMNQVRKRQERRDARERRTLARSLAGRQSDDGSPDGNRWGVQRIDSARRRDLVGVASATGTSLEDLREEILELRGQLSRLTHSLAGLVEGGVQTHGSDDPAGCDICAEHQLARRGG